MKYWMNTISRDHVEVGVEGGFTQAGHGKAAGLKRLNAGDWLVFHSPKTSLDGGERLQAFTATGRVADDELRQAEMAAGFVARDRSHSDLSTSATERLAPTRAGIEVSAATAASVHGTTASSANSGGLALPTSPPASW